MPSITLKNIPETLHQRLRESAARNHRSINGEMLAALDQYVSQQRPTDEKSLNEIDVTGELEKLAARDPHLFPIKVFDLPGQEEQLVLTTPGIVALGETLAEAVLKRR